MRRCQIPAFQGEPKCLSLINFVSWADHFSTHHRGTAVPRSGTHIKHEHNGFKPSWKDPFTKSFLGGPAQSTLAPENWEKVGERVGSCFLAVVRNAPRQATSEGTEPWRCLFSKFFFSTSGTLKSKRSFTSLAQFSAHNRALSLGDFLK